jgi:phage gpG-like protein
MAVRRTGDWALARRTLKSAPLKLRSAVSVAMRQEAQQLRSQIVQGLTQQAPGGTPLKPLSPLTLAARRLAGFKGTKALIVRADLRNSVTVLIEDERVFVGINRKARSRDGRSLVDVARVHEFGGPPVIIPITPKMRRYLAVLFKEAETAAGSNHAGNGSAKSSKGVIVVQVPARPFLRPAFEIFRQGASRRFLERVAKELGIGGLG